VGRGWGADVPCPVCGRATSRSYGTGKLHWHNMPREDVPPQEDGYPSVPARRKRCPGSLFWLSDEEYQCLVEANRPVRERLDRVRMLRWGIGPR